MYFRLCRTYISFLVSENIFLAIFTVPKVNCKLHIGGYIVMLIGMLWPQGVVEAEE